MIGYTMGYFTTPVPVIVQVGTVPEAAVGIICIPPPGGRI